MLEAVAKAISGGKASLTVLLCQLVKLYRDGDAMKAHAGSEYFKAAFAKMGALLAAPPQIEYLDAV